MLKSKAEVHAKLHDSLLYNVHLNWFSLASAGSNQPELQLVEVVVILRLIRIQ